MSLKIVVYFTGPQSYVCACTLNARKVEYMCAVSVWLLYSYKVIKICYRVGYTPLSSINRGMKQFLKQLTSCQVGVAHCPLSLGRWE